MVAKLVCIAALLLPVAAGAQDSDEPPYWASVEVDKAYSRTGPSQEFRIMWVYVRKNLPVRIIKRFGIWRQIEDPDGTQGWMHARLLTRERTAIVRAAITELHEQPDALSRLKWRAEPGVVGKLGECEEGWCFFDVNGRTGYVRADSLWGAGKP